jgi:hypothetical protein
VPDTRRGKNPYVLNSAFLGRIILRVPKRWRQYASFSKLRWKIMIYKQSFPRRPFFNDGVKTSSHTRILMSKPSALKVTLWHPLHSHLYQGRYTWAPTRYKPPSCTKAHVFMFWQLMYKQDYNYHLKWQWNAQKYQIFPHARLLKRNE